jgi:hypothetical protein
LGRPFDAVVHCLAGDGDDAGSLASLRHRGDGIVVAHDVHLAGLYRRAARAGALPGGLAEVIRRTYGDAVMPGVGAHDSLTDGEARRLGILLCRDAVARSRRFLVVAPADATLARLDAHPADRHKVEGVGGDPAAVADRVAAVVADLRSSPEADPGAPVARAGR